MKIKQILFSFVAIVLLLSGFSACNPNQQKLVGTWKFNVTQTNSDDAEADCTTKVTILGTETYNANGENFSQGTERIDVNWTDGELEGVVLSLVYKYNQISQYEVNGDVLTCTPKDVNCSFVTASSNLGYDLKDVERKLVNIFRSEFENDKKDWYKKDVSTIVSITDHKLVLKDDEGEIQEYTR